MTAPLQTTRAVVRCRKCGAGYSISTWASPFEIWVCWAEKLKGGFCMTRNRLDVAAIWPKHQPRPAVEKEAAL